MQIAEFSVAGCIKKTEYRILHGALVNGQSVQSQKRTEYENSVKNNNFLQVTAFNTD